MLLVSELHRLLFQFLPASQIIEQCTKATLSIVIDLSKAIAKDCSLFLIASFSNNLFFLMMGGLIYAEGKVHGVLLFLTKHVLGYAFTRGLKVIVQKLPTS